MPLANLTVAEDIAQIHQLMNQLNAAVIIPWQIIAIGEVEGVDVPIVGVIVLLDNL